MIRRRVALELSLGVVAALVVGCPAEDDHAVGTEGRRLSHAEALGAARAIHAAAIDQATFAKARLDRGMVEGLANTLLGDHRRSLDELQRLVGERSLTPTESSVSLQLREDALQALEELSDESGRELANDYLEAQLALHQRGLEAIDRELLAATSDEPDLLEYMSSLRALLASHLDLARDVQAQEEHRGLAQPADAR